MKRLAALVLCLSLVAEAAPSSGKAPRKRASVVSASATRRAPTPSVPAGPWVVDIQELVPSLRPMPQKEVEDQLRDWALYGLLMRLGLEPDELARTTNQVAPVRLPYLEELFAFEYGRGRRAILSDDRVLLLYEQSDLDPQATLGRLADRVRMELGQVPGSFELYTFTSDVAAGELKLEFKEAVSGRELFSPKYGYHEAVVTSSQELESWLGAVDDVVFVAQVSKGLKLGGRRFEKSRTRSVSLEGVAALYQAHSSLAARRSVSRGMRPVPSGPGFSLDPLLDEKGLLYFLETLAVEPCRAIEELNDKVRASIEQLDHTKALPGSIHFAPFVDRRYIEALREWCPKLGVDLHYSSQLRTIATSARGLQQGVPLEVALAPLYTLKNTLKGLSLERQRFVRGALELVVEANSKQCARYDGPLGGTRVGMNLFYTDLLAKLWALDVNSEAPGLRVPGFLSLARLPDSPYREEDLKKSYTRLWFGPRKESFTRSPDGVELRFQQVATRVFAAGSDPNELQKKEGTPNENSRRALGWWERHYADVADYEQEYHLQNQIMKWSVITGFLREKWLAPYLEKVAVSHAQQFGEWYEQRRSELKYQLPLVVEGKASKECLDILTTRAGISGGVTLSGGKVARVPVVELNRPANLRHSLGAITGGEPAAKALGRTLPEYVASGLIRVEPLPTTTTRMNAFQLELGAVELAHASPRKGDYQLTLRTKQAPVGDFRGTRSGERIHLNWHPHEIGEAPALARRVTQTEGPLLVAVTHYTGKGSKNVPFRPWYSPVFVADSSDVFVPSAKGGGYTRIHLQSGARTHTRPDSLSSVLDRYPWQQLTADKAASELETSQGVVRRPVRTGPLNASQVHIEGMDGSPEGLTVYVDDSGLYLSKPRNANAQRSWYELDRFTQDDLHKIRAAGARGDATISSKDLSDGRAEKAIRELVAGDEARFRKLRTVLSKELGPERGPQELQRHLVAAADFKLAQGDSKGASRLYELARDHFGEASPGAILRATLAGVHSGKKHPGVLEEVLTHHASKLSVQERIQVMQTTQGLEDMPDVPEVLRARLGFPSAIPVEVTPRIHLERDGPDVVSAYRPEKPIRFERIAPDEFDQGVPEDAAIYVEDGFSFNKNDFQVSPGKNIAELGRNPEVDVKRIEEMGTGAFRPGKIYAQESAAQGAAPGRVYRRVAGPIAAAAGTGAIYVIRARWPRQFDPCDKNGDGQVSEEERQQCKAA